MTYFIQDFTDTFGAPISDAFAITIHKFSVVKEKLRCKFVFMMIFKQSQMSFNLAGIALAILLIIIVNIALNCFPY